MDEVAARLSRREFLRAAAYATAGASLLRLGPLVSWAGAAAAKKGTLSFADIGVGDPGGDWSKFTNATGWGVNLVAIGNAPSQILNVLIAGGGKGVYDVINIVGGMQKPLVENDLIIPIATSRLPNWGKDAYISEFLSSGKPGFEFIGYKGKIYGVPTVLQGDSFAYLPEKTGQLDSYAALFDPKWKGFVALEDNFTTAGQKTALYLKTNKLATIKDPANMTPGEIRTVIDFLIEKKKEGQFRVIWTSFEQAVDLLTRREVYVMDCWEPMVFAARKKGVSAVYARPKEGYLLWAMAAYIVKNPQRPADREKGAYDLLNFMLDGWYGAKITLLRGYMTNPQAVAYAKANAGDFSAAEAAEVARIHDNVRSKFRLGGTWQNRWPTYVEQYESEWARFKAAPSK
ncbi:MAG: extracellular solute-binding protein [Armatimonadota bacterium]|nr:extracellular solute-binding protein [Armatimonadota bacterium]MDR7450334.1 extracellular solute-binding protein [Armatimonadota bacterium]MDR7467083.1 extracellular solute-binding protein [Armatimonadota bacterium]MDR7493375.1 extracellular solute-binding protein [Armatimonadota bacterium]MDR7499383.1 extracellular solute-binding protein [Armatimonadota bacterium]